MLELRRSQTSYAAEVELHKKAASATINEIVSEKRRQFITPLPGQEMIYLSKELEATRFLSEGPEPSDLSTYPFIAGEVGSTGATAREVAEVFLAMSNLWRSVGSQIEALRITANVALRSATTDERIAEILAELQSALETIGA